MSLRTLIEINHDALETTRGLLEALYRYRRSANSHTAGALEQYGLKVLGMRHHSGNFVLDGTPDGFPVQHLERVKET